jgi:hypothetical protein
MHRSCIEIAVLEFQQKLGYSYSLHGDCVGWMNLKSLDLKNEWCCEKNAKALRYFCCKTQK